MTDSITPPKQPSPEIRFQPSMLSVPSSASTVRPGEAAPPSQAQPRRGARRKLWFFTALAVVAGALGATALGSSPRISTQLHSGSPGFKRSKGGQTMHWHTNAHSIYLDESLKQLGPNADDAVMQAFGRWVQSNSNLPNLAFDTGKTSAIPKHDGKSTISYGRITAPGHEQDLAITVTYAREDTGEIVEADIVLNNAYRMAVLKAVDCQNRYDVQNVTTHEVGHFFGLGEDPVERGSAMFQTIDQCETHKRELSGTDTTALATLYAQVEDPEEVAAGPRACSLTGAPASSGWAWVSALILGLCALGRRRTTRC